MKLRQSMSAHLESSLSLETLRTVLDNLSEGVVTADASGQLLDWNPAALALHGYATREEALNRLPEYPELFQLETLQGEVVPLESWPMSRALRGESFNGWELIVRRKDTGAEKVFSYSGRAVFESGKVALAVLTLQDVTERKQTERALRRSEAQLRDFVENATVGLHWVGPDGKILWANRTELDMLGYSRDEYIGRSITDFHADPPVIEEILQTLTRGGELCNREARLRCKDGSIRHVLISSNVLFEGDKFVHTRCFTRDITDRVRAESEAHDLAHRFSALADNIDQLAWMADAEGAIYWYNRRWYEFTGTTAGDMEGWGWQSVHDPTILPTVLERWKESIATGAPFNMEFPLRGADGQFRPFLTRVHPLRNEKGEVERWFGTNTDIADQKQAQRALESLSANLESLVAQRTEALLESNEQLQSFTYSVAHDFRQHIRGVSANASMVLADAGPLLDEESRENLQAAIQSARYMSTLTDDLLRYAKLGKTELRSAEVDVSSMVNDVWASDIREREYCNPATKFVLQPGLTVQGDPSLLRLAFVNLLDNACKYSHKADEPTVEVGASDGVFFVSDNGTGFDMQYSAKLFQPFERLHGDDAFEGTGIGLANVKRIVERHGGRIWAESSPGKGATFSFTLKSDAAPNT